MAERKNQPRPGGGPRGRGVEKPKDTVGTFKRLLLYFKDYLLLTIAFLFLFLFFGSY